MNKFNSKNWEERMTKIYLDNEESILEVAQLLRDFYNLTEKEIQQYLAVFFSEYLDFDEEITWGNLNTNLDKIQLRYFRKTIDEKLKEAKQNNYSSKYINKLNKLKTVSKVTKVQDLKINLEHSIQKLERKKEVLMTNKLKEIYEDVYYKTIYTSQMDMNITSSFGKPNLKLVEKALKKQYDIKNYNVKLYDNAEKLMHILNVDIPQGLLLGQNPRKLAKIVNDDLGTNYKYSLRLIRTEYNLLMNEATADAYKEIGVEKYQLLAALNERTCEDCGKLDSKFFDLKDKEVGLNYPPFHPNCRCTTIPYIEPDEFDNLNATIMRRKNGVEYEVPLRISYAEWKAGLKEKNGKLIYSKSK